jgi:lysophospholipase L1-like esterase
VLLAAAFKIYRRMKTRNEIEETLTSDHWMTRFDDFLSEPRTKEGIIFLGNSLTEKFNLSVFNDSTIINRGISSDFTEGLLKRIDEVNSLQPSKLFIEIGINDIFAKVPPDEIIENYEKIIESIKKKSPQTKIYIQSNLPVLREGNLTSCAELNKIITDQNEQLKKLASKYGLTYINLYDHFVKDGALDPQLSFDGVHITKSGYDIWKEILLPYLKN